MGALTARWPASPSTYEVFLGVRAAFANEPGARAGAAVSRILLSDCAFFRRGALTRRVVAALG